MLSVRQVSHSYEGAEVLHGLNLEVIDGEILCILGPSGCGKTTLLRIIAGLETPDKGDILLNSETILKTPIHQRKFGLMFQDYALFPHLNVQDNVAFGLKMRGYGKEEQIKQTNEALALVGLQHFSARKVTELSGGEQQRVALARSLAPHPHLLMLDEPLGSLDAALKAQLTVDLRKIIKDAGITSIYVTHDQNEAFSIGDRIVVMRAGGIEQIDTPRELYLHPRTEFVARFLEFPNILPIQICKEFFDEGQLEDILLDNADDTAHQSILLHPEKLRPQHQKPIRPEYPGVYARVCETIYQGDKYRITSIVEGTDYGLTVFFSVNDTIPEHDARIWIEYDPKDSIPLC